MSKTQNRNIAFFDAEFTAITAEDRGIQEMIQCAFIVYEVCFSGDDKIVSIADSPSFVYNTFIRPTYNKELSDYIKGLTGISQENVDAGKDFCHVIDELYQAAKQYKIGHILTWGPDQILLKHNCDVLDYDNIKSKMLRKKFIDISKQMSDFLGYRVAISQHKTCQILGITEDGDQHDAYYDAINLSKIIKELCGQIHIEK
jgi:inhibitor of KinA sporulation pathway (predicted exonuclease)